MRKTITYAHISGIPLKVHWNWFPLAGLVAFTFSVGYFPLLNSDWPQGLYWLVGIATTFLFFGSVLIHELAHALVALREGVGVNSITLFILGGASHIASEPSSARSDFRIVAAGPIASLTLSLIYFIAAASSSSPAILEMSNYLSNMNFMLAGFNLIPGFPLDGGRIIRALLWQLTGNQHTATRLAVYGGYMVAILLVACGIGVILLGRHYSVAWAILIGLFLAYFIYDSDRKSKSGQTAAFDS